MDMPNPAEFDEDYDNALDVNGERIYDDGWKLDSIHSAANFGFLSDVEEFIERKSVDVNQKNESGWTALMYASYCDFDDIVVYLIQQKAQLDLKNDEGCTALILASMCGHSLIVAKLLENNASVELCDQSGWSALFHATNTCQHGVVQVLLKSGANVNSVEEKSGYTPLMIAAMEGSELIARTLVNHGANVSTRSLLGDTAQSLAMENKHLGIASFLDSLSLAVSNENASCLFNGPRDINKLLQQQHLEAPTNNDRKFPDNMPPVSRPHNLKTLLELYGLTKYAQLLDEHEICFSTFLTLTDEEIQEIGIKTIGARKKICFAIKRWHANAPMGTSVDYAYADNLSLKVDQLTAELAMVKKEMELLKSKLAFQQNGAKRSSATNKSLAPLNQKR